MFIFLQVVIVNMELSTQMGMVMLFLASVVQATRIAYRGPAEMTIHRCLDWKVMCVGLRPETIGVIASQALFWKVLSSKKFIYFKQVLINRFPIKLYGCIYYTLEKCEDSNALCDLLTYFQPSFILNMLCNIENVGKQCQYRCNRCQEPTSKK